MLIRISSVALFLIAGVLAASASIPKELPALALGQGSVYRVEILLVLVYGGLLLLTPLFYGVFHGQLPIELSHRGAKWESASNELEDADQQIEELVAERTQLLRERRQLEAAAAIGANMRRRS